MISMKELPSEQQERILQRFSDAVREVNEAGGASEGFGTLGERPLHAALKCFIEPSGACQEQKLHGFQADVLTDSGIYEIQTGAFERLRKKLEIFLPDYPVTVVYPIPAVKYLSWIDPETGEITERRKSPKKGRPCEVLPELLYLSELYPHPNFRLMLLMVEEEDMKLLCGWSRDGKRGSRRVSRMALSLQDLYLLEKVSDLRFLMPQKLAEPFTTAEFSKAAGLRGRKGWAAVRALVNIGFLVSDGKRGRAEIYRTGKNAEE